MIRQALPADALALSAIYNHHIEHSTATFEEVPLSADDMAHRLEQISARWPWLVCERTGEVAGYAYASKWQERSAYRFAVEVAVYTAPGLGGARHRQRALRCTSAAAE